MVLYQFQYVVVFVLAVYGHQVTALLVAELLSLRPCASLLYQQTGIVAVITTQEPLGIGRATLVCGRGCMGRTECIGSVAAL